MIVEGGESRSLLPARRNSECRLRSHSMLFLIFVIAAGIWVTILVVSSIDRDNTYKQLPSRIDFHPISKAFWKDDPAVSVETVLDRISYWTYNKQYKDVDFEFVAPDPQERYLTFEPDQGGFNNIRMQLEILVQIARATRRTLVLPPDFTWNHLDGKSNLNDYFQLDQTMNYVRIIDVDDYLEFTGASIRSSTHSVGQIFEFLRNHERSFSPKWHPDQEALVFQHDSPSERIPSALQFLNGRQPIYYDHELMSYRTLHFRSDYENGYRLLAVPCTFVYYPTVQWERYVQAMIRDGFHYRHDIFTAAATVIQQILSRSGRYNAVHVRRNDFRLQYADKVIGWDELSGNLQKILDPDLAIYIATDEDVQKDADFEQFRQVFNKVYLFHDFQLPDEIHRNWHGMIEQIICSNADRFIGTELSTFTAYIHRLRGYMSADVAPDKQIYYTTDKLTGYAVVDGWRTYRTWMKLSDHDVVDNSGSYWQREYWISWQL